MAIEAIGCCVCTQKRKTCLLMYFCDIANQPRLRRMALGTIGTKRIFMHIGVALHTLIWRLSKHQAFVAAFAIDHIVLTFE